MADGEHSPNGSMGEARAQFHAMVDGTQEDWMAIAMAASQFSMELPRRVIAHLELLKGDCGGFAVDRYEHSLQTATRALRAGQDEEYVVCALLHDIGDTLGPRNHADVAAAILKPFVSEQNHWMVANHAIFQGYYFFDYLGLDKNMRDQFKGHPWYEYTAQFCHLYDQNSFDPNYDTEPLATFVPMLERVLTTVKTSIYMREDAGSVI
ncbi:MAG TPA: HD domain-containing protein [Caulobacteraceae bacterium]|nr:HD domain-containing protein [Caulobacteraceae bacterium]